MKSLRSACFFAAVVSVFSLAQSSRPPAVSQPNDRPNPSMGRINWESSPEAMFAPQRAAGLGNRKQPSPMQQGPSFTPPVSYDSGGPDNFSVAVADVNGDSKPDMIVANWGGNGVSLGVLLGNGDGTFQNVQVYDSGGYYTYYVAVTDVNGDGKPDLVATSGECGNCKNGDGIVSVLLGNGDGTFQPAVTYDSGASTPSSVAIADVNGDGKPDLVVANQCGDEYCNNGAVAVLLGNGDGTFKPAVLYPSGADYTMSVALADVNGDGKLDVIAVNECGGYYCYHDGFYSFANIQVMLGNGDGTFQAPWSEYSGGCTSFSVAVDDLNADGRPDLIVSVDGLYDENGSTCVPGSGVAVLFGNGDGTFQQAVTYSSSGQGARGVALGDVNGDGRPDVIVANEDTTVGVLLGNGDGTFQTGVTFTSGGYDSLWVAAADVNGDGKPDLAVANRCGDSSCGGDGSVGVLINTTTFSPNLATLVNFDGANGGDPILMTLVQGTDGNFYGTTFGGGASNEGTVFKITPGGVLTTLYSFCMQTNCTDGSNPESGLVLAADGNFYGTTTGGGTNQDGTVFKITPAGILTTLHNFDVGDGAEPWGKLIQAVDGDFYGTTFGGGAHGGGTVFKITSSGTLTTLYSFCAQFNCADGASPEAGLVQSVDGSFFGTTDSNGGNFGTIFKITPLGALTTLHSFDGTDGAQPVGTLIQASDGNFYGTTQHEGPLGYGTVFRITSAGKLATLHSFNSTDGANPTAGLIQATDGNLYGTTASGGTSNDGTIFEIAKGDILTTLHNFAGADGAHPQGGLLESTSGVLYGTTSQGGNSSAGTVYGLTVDLGPSVAFVRGAGKAGQAGSILGQGFAGTYGLRLNALAAKFKVVSDTLILATVPEGATTGYVTVTTPTGVLKSNVPFRVIQ